MPFLIAYALPGLFQRHNWAVVDWWMWGIELTNRDGALTWAVL